MKREQLTLYAITDRSYLCGMPLAEAVREAILGGVTLVQLREKNMGTEELVKSALKIKAVCAEYGVPLIINDDVRAALIAGADGVHLGQGDMPVSRARELLGDGKIIGVTAKTAEQAVKAESDGADYIGSGAVFGTSTKQDAKKLELSVLKEITAAVKIPVAAIGGITADNIAALRGTGIAGAAVVSGIFAENDIRAAARRLRSEAEKITGEEKL